MQAGNWVPISKWAVKYLPKVRPYSKLEALVSIQIDYDSGNSATISGYAALWRWSRNKVTSFLKAIGVEIIYPENTKKRQNQKGQIMGRSAKKKGQIRFIDNKELQDQKDRCSEKKGQIKDTTRETKYLNTIFRQILDLYHDILAELPKVQNFTERRCSMLKARWNEKAKSQSGLYSNTLEFWEAFFKYIRESDWLMGRKGDWKANFEWIITKRNFNKIIEGNYHA
jgi:hypothetical protein